MTEKSGWLWKQGHVRKVGGTPSYSFFSFRFSFLFSLRNIDTCKYFLTPGFLRQSWRHRWFVLKPLERTLLYYKKAEDAAQGKVTIQPDDFMSFIISTIIIIIIIIQDMMKA